jgi:hypothetical protein
MTTTIVRVENHEGNGDCQECQRHGLKWVLILSDGSRVGAECAKKILGLNVKPADYGNPIAGLALTASHTEYGTHFTLYTNDRKGVITRNGYPTTSGPVAWVTKEWQTRYAN